MLTTRGDSVRIPNSSQPTSRKESRGEDPGFSPFISDTGRLSLSASVHAAADAITRCHFVHLLLLLSLSHSPTFK